MYVKLFKSIFDGTLRGKSDALLVWVNLLAHADREGFVDRHFKAIAEETGLPEKRVRDAISDLESPDPESRSQDLEGRRLERLDEHREWGWRIVNYLKYRNIKDQEDKREYNRTAQQRFRDKENTKIEDEQLVPAARQALHFLNEKSGRSFRETDPNLSVIIARLREKGVDLEGVKKMVERQCLLWKGDPKMEEYLRPETLFRKSKFDNYYGGRDLPVATAGRAEKHQLHEGVKPRIVDFSKPV